MNARYSQLLDISELTDVFFRLAPYGGRNRASLDSPSKPVVPGAVSFELTFRCIPVADLNPDPLQHGPRVRTHWQSPCPRPPRFDLGGGWPSKRLNVVVLSEARSRARRAA